MVGLPGETFEQALETLRLNIRLKPAVALCSVFQPFPGTALADEALRKGYLTPEAMGKMGSKEFGALFHSRSPLRQPEIHKAENLQKVGAFVARHPSFFPVAKFLAGFRVLQPLFRLSYRAYVFWYRRHRRSRDAY